MNKIYTRIACFMATALLLTACAQDEMTDGDSLPEGKYPLQIASVSVVGESTAEPWGAKGVQSRVAESTDGSSSLWEDGDLIRIVIEGNGYTPSDDKTYEITVSGENVTVAPSEDGTPVYWKNTATATVNAWFPLDETVSLGNQEDKLKYVLKSSTEGTYESDVELDFKHSLAKVCVKISSNTSGKDIETIRIKSYTTCTNTKGEVSTEGASEGWITMMRVTRGTETVWEANVVPDKAITDIEVEETQSKLSGNGITPLEGKINTINLTVNKAMKEINISEIKETEYTVSGNVHLKGDGNSKNLKLQMEGGSKLTLEDVKLSPNSGNAITCNGDASITLKGENSITSNNIGIYVKGGTLTVNGDDNTSSMTVTGNGYMSGAGIGATNNANITINGGKIKANEGGKQESAGIGSAGWGETCGTITINGGTIESWGGGYSAGIGGSNSGACGDIIITGGNIKAYGGLQSPGIGCGDVGACKNITITGGTIIATKGSNSPASIGACTVTKPEGTVTIDRNGANVTEN